MTNYELPIINNKLPANTRLFSLRFDWLWVMVMGLGLQAFWALRLTHPSYMDAYYYTINGQRLADGFGFSVPVVWQYLDGLQAGLPALSHTYWMPLPSLLAMIGYLFGDSFRTAQLPFWLLAGLLPWLSYTISFKLSGERWQAWTAAIFTAAGGYYAAYFSQPTSFAPFAWAGGAGLLLLAMTSDDSKIISYQLSIINYSFLAGILSGLAHLTRADGILFLLVGIWLWLINIDRTPKTIIPLFAGYLLVMTPWFFHNLLTIGRILPTAGTQTIFLTTYDDLFAYGRSFHLADYLAWGWPNIIQSKLDALWLAGQQFIAVSGLVFLSPFVLIGWIGVSRSERGWLLRPLTWYSLALFGAMVFVFTFPSGRGSILHSSAAIWPWMMPLTAAGIGYTVDWIAKKLTHWEAKTAKPRFAGMFALVVFAVSLIVSGGQPRRNEEAEALREIGAEMPASAVIMSGNPPMIYYHTGLPAISLPNEPIAGVLQAAQDYGVTHIIMDLGHPKTMTDIWEGTETHPELTAITSIFSETEAHQKQCLKREEKDGHVGDDCPLYRVFAITSAP